MKQVGREWGIIETRFVFRYREKWVGRLGAANWVLTNVPHVSDIASVNALLLNTRELSKDTAKVLRNLPKSGPRVITRGSEPVGILIPPSPGGIEADIELLGRLRLGQALAATQREAVLNNSANLTMTDIDAEISAARSARRIKTNATTPLGH